MTALALALSSKGAAVLPELIDGTVASSSKSRLLLAGEQCPPMFWRTNTCLAPSPVAVKPLPLPGAQVAPLSRL